MSKTKIILISILSWFGLFIIPTFGYYFGVFAFGESVAPKGMPNPSAAFFAVVGFISAATWLAFWCHNLYGYLKNRDSLLLGNVEDY